MLTKTEILVRTFEGATNGDKIIYHIGCLAFDRDTTGKGGACLTDAQDISGIADYFALMAKRGVAMLVQKRIVPIINNAGPYIHEYIAIKT